MRHELTFNGKAFSDFDAYIASSNFLDSAQKSVTMVTIPGRSGNLSIDNNRFENITITENLYITQDMQDNFGAMRNYLNSTDGYCRLEDTNSPNEFRMGLYRTVFSPDRYDAVAGTVKVQFDCKPQRYLVSGETETTVSSGSVVSNPTAFNSKPLITVTGYGTLSIGTTTITIAAEEDVISSSTIIYIDCEMMNCFTANHNVNKYVTFSSNDFPQLKPGNNTFTYSGNISAVKVKPRWWTI